MGRLIGEHRSIGDKERGRRRRQAKTDASELPRCQEEVRILESRTSVDRAARAVDGIVEEVERALEVEGLLVTQRCLDLVCQRSALLLTFTLERQIVLLAHVEVEINRVERDK